MNKNFFALVAIILGALLYPFFIMPLWADIQIRQADKAQIEAAQQNVDNFVKKYNELAGKLNSFDQNELNRLAELLPESVNALGTIVDIEDIARNNGFVMKGSVGVDTKQNISPQDQPGAAPQSPYDTTLFTINVVGPYSSLKPFLEDLAKSLTLFDITSLSFANSETGVYDFQIILKAYSLAKK